MAGSLGLLYALSAAGGIVAGEFARWLHDNVSRHGRLDRQLRRLEQSGAIAIEGAGLIDARIVRLTAGGRRKALGGPDPDAEWARRWDGLWRLVVFDIPERRTALRTKLRRRLHECRFGWLQNSVWITPDSIADFRAGLGETGVAPESLTCLEARTIGGESNEALVSSAWDFVQIGRIHAAYIDVLKLRPSRRAGRDEWLRWLAIERRAWKHVLRRDPFLPDALLPPGYRGKQAWSIRSVAMREFASVVRRGVKHR